MSITSERLYLREFTLDDAEFILELVNDPDFITNIGDKGVKNIEDAKDYLAKGPIQSYWDNQFGMYLVSLRETNRPIGMCGLVFRDFLKFPDLGYGFLPEGRGLGFAQESSKAVLTYASDVLHLKDILAICNEDNLPSIRLLERLGFQYKEPIQLPNNSNSVNLYQYSPKD